MNYTQEQLSGFKQEFAKKRQRQFLVGGLTVLAFLSLVLLQRNGMVTGAPLALVWIAGVAVAVLFSWQNWRCPACGKYLGRSGNLAFCPRCGVALR